MVGTRIKCKKCGNSFHVAAPVSREPIVAASAVGAQASPALAAVPGGIAVEGLDDSAWTSQGEHAAGPLAAESATGESPESHESHAFVAHEGAHREYKIICSRDKIFEAKFDLVRLEEVLNHYARDGWVVKAMTTPHLKTFGETVKEEVVVLLER
jgi:hypothetical protein